MPAISLAEILNLSLPPVTILDVGAGNYGDASPYKQLVDQGLAQVVGVEPNPEEFAHLCEAADPGYNFLPHCLGQGGIETFYSTAMPQCSSIYLPDLDLINQFVTLGRPEGEEGPFSVREASFIETQRLDDVAGQYQPELIKLDTQGSELDILMGAEETLKNVLAIQTEVEFIPLYQGQPLFGDIQLFLRDRNFWLQKFLDIQGRNFIPVVAASPQGVKAISQVIWADAIFVRNYSDLSHYSDEQLLKASLIMHELYHSYDFVQWLLKAYDRRQGTELNPQYFDVLTRHPLEFKYMNLIE